MSQLAFAEAEYAIKKRKTCREKLLDQLEVLIPWQKIEQPLAKQQRLVTVAATTNTLINSRALVISPFIFI